MATGDITSVSVAADGWSCYVTIEGFTTGATYDFGSLDDSPATVDSPTFTMTVVSEGYNSSGVLGTVTRTVYGTIAVRKPYPDNASKDEDTTTTPGSMIVRVALSDCVYNDDKNGGAGTSGTNPTVTISAGWCVNTGGASQSSAAVTNLAVTNNSTLDYPKVIAQWAWGHTPAWRRVEAAFDMGCIAYHGHGIACVALSATEGVNSVTGTATTKTKHLMSASGLYYESYDLNVPLTSMTQGNDITLKFVVYPTVGDADSIIDTSTNTTTTDDIRGLTQITCTCDKTGALKDYAVVTTTGNDGTGAKSTTLATAESTPFLTIGRALQSGATVIYCRTGTFDWLGSTPSSVTQQNYAIEVSPYPGETALLERQSTWKIYRAKHLVYKDFTDIKCVNASGYLDGNNVAGAHLQFINCTFTKTVLATIGNGYRSEGCWYTNCSLADDDFEDFSTSRVAYAFNGCIGTEPFQATPWYAIVACNFSSNGDQGIGEKGTGNIAPVQNNLLICNSKVLSCTTSSFKIFSVCKVSNQTGVAIVGNIFEARSGTQPAFWVAADNAITTVDSCIVAHNTVVGERSNLFYNDTGTSAISRTNVFVRNNAFRGFNIKADLFGTANGNRVGNWAQVNGVNFSDNRYDGTDGSSFIGDYRGINVAFVTSTAAVYGEMGYTNEQSLDLGGAGGGNYLPTTGSALKNHVLRVKYQSYDMDGVAL